MSQKKESLKVVQGETLRMFVCGPTVQSFIHVGHARTYVFYDVLSRYLTHLGFRVNFLVNITDVDDRITEAAKREGVKTAEIVQRYTASFFEDLNGLDVKSVTSFERVSNYIQVMIDQISILVGNGYAYLADGVVYFDTSKYPDYGRLSHQSKSDLSLRPLELTANKKSLLDFALWRPVVLEEGKWDSPWGRGSPGWHIEDTAVTLTNFLVRRLRHPRRGLRAEFYPHHEAELAQGESLTGIRPLVRYWVHTGLVNLSGRKYVKVRGEHAPRQGASQRIQRRRIEVLPSFVALQGRRGVQHSTTEEGEQNIFERGGQGREAEDLRCEDHQQDGAFP